MLENERNKRLAISKEARKLLEEICKLKQRIKLQENRIKHLQEQLDMYELEEQLDMERREYYEWDD
jgi:hypothetical protein